MSEPMTDSPQFDRAAVLRDFNTFYGDFGALLTPVWFELRAIRPGGERNPPFQRFRPTPQGFEDAADWAETFNNLDRQIYGVRGAIRDDIDPRKGASDADIVAQWFLWADCDDGAAADNVARFEGPRPNVVLITGKKPERRAHTYWRLDEPCMNMAAHRALQEAIAAHFQSDRTVVNASRIMRIAGTINHAKPNKPGRVAEVVAMKCFEDRETLQFERALRVWPTRTNAGNAAANEFSFDVGAAPLDRERAVIRALDGQEWHNAVIRLVASYVSKGLSDAEIHTLTDPLTLAGYTVEQTRQEVQVAIDGARRKGWGAEAAGTRVNFDFAPGAADEWEDAPDAAPKTWRVQTFAEFTADFVAPEWIVDGVIQRGRLYTCTAPTGHAKTAFWLYAACMIATGGQICGRDVEGGDVIYMAGENPDDVRARAIAAAARYGIDPAKIKLHFVPGTFSIRQDIDRLRQAIAALPNVVLVVVDTLAAYFDGDDDNSNAQMLDFARVVRSIAETASRPAVVMPAHPTKRAPKGDLTPRGGGAMLNEVDGNLTIWKDEAVATLHWQGKIRGPDFDPLKVEISTVEDPRVHDRNGRLIPTVIALPVLEMRAEALARESMSREDAVLLSIADDGGAPARQRVADCGLPSTGTLSRILDRLHKAKLIRKKHREWVLTGDGEDAVKAIRAGAAGAESIGDDA